jgi:hypothetical protein
MARLVMSGLSSFLTSNGALLVGILFVAAVIAVTLIMTAQSNEPDRGEPRNGR